MCLLPKLTSDLTLVLCARLVLVLLGTFSVALALPNVTNVVLNVNVTMSTGIVVFTHIGRRLARKGDMRTSLGSKFRGTVSTVISKGVAALVTTNIL